VQGATGNSGLERLSQERSRREVERARRLDELKLISFQNSM